MSQLVGNNSDENTKPIFSSTAYLESSTGFCDLCFAIIDCDKELYYQCDMCVKTGIIACLGCIKRKTKRLVSHPSDHIFFANKAISNTSWTRRNLGVVCDLCGEENFFGKRYKCQQCPDYDSCSKCLPEVPQKHFPSEPHTFAYIPNPTRIHLNRYLLAARALQILQLRNAGFSEQDDITGWTSAEAQFKSSYEMNNYYALWRQASAILDDPDIGYKPSIIENEKKKRPFVSVGKN